MTLPSRHRGPEAPARREPPARSACQPQACCPAWQASSRAACPRARCCCFRPCRPRPRSSPSRRGSSVSARGNGLRHCPSPKFLRGKCAARGGKFPRARWSCCRARCAAKDPGCRSTARSSDRAVPAGAFARGCGGGNRRVPAGVHPPPGSSGRAAARAARARIFFPASARSCPRQGLWFPVAGPDRRTSIFA